MGPFCAGHFMWLQCYGLYVIVLGLQHPRISELMAYQATIVQASQDYQAWPGYITTPPSGGKRPSPD